MNLLHIFDSKWPTVHRSTYNLVAVGPIYEWIFYWYAQHQKSDKSRKTARASARDGMAHQLAPCFCCIFLIWEQRDSTVTWHKIDCFATKRMFSGLHNIFLPKMRAKGNFNYLETWFC